MLQVFLIGHIGADADKKDEQGRKFTTFRVAHSERYTTQDGQSHEQTIWVDCVLNDHPAVADYLRQGQLVAVIGSARLRVYSSAKDRCIKAGLTISVRNVELLGSAPDEIPRRLFDIYGEQHDVYKAFYVTDVANQTLMDIRGNQFAVDDNRWVKRIATDAAAASAADGAAATAADGDAANTASGSAASAADNADNPNDAPFL